MQGPVPHELRRRVLAKRPMVATGPLTHVDPTRCAPASNARRHHVRPSLGVKLRVPGSRRQAVGSAHSAVHVNS